jgi:integrase
MASVHRYRTKSGELRYGVRWRDGTGRQRSRSFSRSKDADRFKVEQDRARQLGHLYEAPRERFGDFLAGWLTRHERRVRPSTFEREAQSLRRFHVLSRFYVEEITAARVEEIVMTGGTRQGQIALRLVKRVLADARSRGQRVHEAVFGIESPRHETRDPRFLTWAEVEELASYCREQRLIVVAALSGLRRGELFALTAVNVDLSGATITVAATGDGGKVGRPKGGKVRRVHVERRVVELLAEQLREREPNGGDLVFPTPRGAMWNGSNFRERVFDPAKRRAELDEMIFHDLRHTYASLLIAASVQPMVVAEQLGNTEARLVLQRYGHLYPGAATRGQPASAQTETLTRTVSRELVDAPKPDIYRTRASERLRLRRRRPRICRVFSCGACGIRTRDPQLAKLVLSQLS